MAMRPFFNVEIQINGFPYVTAEASIEDQVGDIDATNTEGVGILTAVQVPTPPPAFPGFATSMSGIEEARITVRNASFDDADVPFIAPYNIRAGSFISFALFPGSSGLPAATPSAWLFPTIRIQSTTHAGQIRQGQPISFTAISNGIFTFSTDPNIQTIAQYLTFLQNALVP